MTPQHISTDETYFFADLRGAGWRTLFAFSKKDLEKGASLSRMMNEKVRVTLTSCGGLISTFEIKEIARNILLTLRDAVEQYFATRR